MYLVHLIFTDLLPERLAPIIDEHPQGPPVVELIPKLRGQLKDDSVPRWT